MLPSTITLAAEPLGFVLTDRRLKPLSFLTYRRDSRPSRRDSANVLNRRERTMMDTILYKSPLDKRYEDLVTETRQGFPYYDGSSRGIEEWKFKVLSKYHACTTDDKKSEIASKACEGLQGEALRVAMDIGTAKLAAPDGLVILIKAMEAMVRPLQKEEAKNLWKIGSRSDGPMSRQWGESFASYTSRRRRW